MHTCLAENTEKKSHGSCRAVSRTLSPGWTQTWPMANLVMYCGIIVKVRKALGATYVCTTINITTENTGCVWYTFLCVYWREICFLSVLRGEVSAVGEHSCKNGPSCAPPHGASASGSGFGIILFNHHLIGDANGHDTGHRVNELTTTFTSGGPGPSQCTLPPSLTPVR